MIWTDLKNVSNEKEIRTRRCSKKKCQLHKLKTYIKKTTPYIFFQNNVHFQWHAPTQSEREQRNGRGVEDGGEGSRKYNELKQ